MTADAPNINLFWAGVIVEEFIRNGVNFFCISPGSRSTPLTTAAARHPEARHVVHFDERGGAFFATGYARATGKPAVWITTSGTAVANGLPAAVEATADCLPLILLTADRPPELRATGANQTIDQVKIFGDYAKEFFELPTPDPSLDPAMLLTTVDQVVHRSISRPAGPVHINCMFRKPLAPEIQSYEHPNEKRQFRQWTSGDTPYTTYARSCGHPSANTVKETAHHLRGSDRGLLIAGRLQHRQQGRAVASLAERLQWPLLADVGSQIRLEDAGTAAIPYFDRVLAAADRQSERQPETVVQFGSRCTSKTLRTFLSLHPPERYIVVKDYPDRLDIDHSVSSSVEVDIEAFTRKLTEELPLREETPWLQSWKRASKAAASAIDRYMRESDEVREPRIARLLTRHLPSDHGLFLASSRPVRDVDMYGEVRDHAVRVAANRGASGIDGTIASAAGFARGLGRPVTLLVGDLALLHDLNALAVVRDAPQPVIVVAINNNGGGIFSFLPIARHADVFEEFFATPFDVTFAQAASMFDIPYYDPTTSTSFVEQYRSAVDAGEPALIELRTERSVNRDEHEHIQQMVAEALPRGHG